MTKRTKPIRKAKPSRVGPNAERKREVNRKNKALRRKQAKVAGKGPVRDEAYRTYIRSMPCVICRKLQRYSTADYLYAARSYRSGVAISQCAHMGERGFSQKCSDRETLPLCAEHHERGYPASHHTLGKSFDSHYGIDRNALIEGLNRIYEGRKAAVSEV